MPFNCQYIPLARRICCLSFAANFTPSLRTTMVTIVVALVVFFSSSCLVTAQEECSQVNNGTNGNSLEFLFMASNGSSFNSYSSFVGMEIALERIRANTSLLNNYTLNYSNIIDSQCSRTPSLSQFIQQINNPCQTFLAVIGSGCSVATEPVAEIGSYWGLSQVSFGSSAINLGNRNRFRNYFQLYTPEDNYIPGIAAIIEYYGWKQIVLLTQKENLFTETHVTLLEILRNKSIQVLPSIQYESYEDPANIDNLFPENSRIFFVNSYENKARQVVCSAYNRGLYGNDRYVWIFYGWYSDRWWEEPSTDDPFNCTSSELYTVVSRSLAVQHYPINEMRNKQVIGNLSYSEFIELYNAKLQNEHALPTYVAHIAYDATWTLALALDRVIRRIDSYNNGSNITGASCTGVPRPLEEWNYRISTSSCLIREELSRTNFEGLTGVVRFGSNGIRLRSLVRIYQYRASNLVRVATWDHGGEFTYISPETNATIFQEGIPSDGTPIRRISTPHISLVVIFYVATLIGITFCVICLIFTIVFRNKTVIRLTSPNLNYFIITGSAMVFISIFFRVSPFIITDEEEYKLLRKIFCVVSLVLAAVGYSLAFGTILVKMWRVYYIFHNPSPNKITFSDIHLIIGIIVITVVMCVIIALGFMIPQTRPTLRLETDKENENRYNDKGIRVNYYVYTCFSHYTFIWLCFLYIYLGALQIIALILAIQTRKVRIKVLNDSKEVAAIIYITSIVLVELAIVSFVLSTYNNVYETLFSGGLFVASMVIMMVIFVPKMIQLYRDPKGENVIDNTLQSSAAVEVGTNGRITVVTDKQRIAMLQAEVANLKTKLGEQTQTGGPRRSSAVAFADRSLEQSLNSLPRTQGDSPV